MKTLEYYFLWFMIYSIVGWIYESILCSVTQKKLVNRGFLNGPYCPIYGVGAVLDILVLGRIENPAALFLLGALLTCSLEYLTSYLMEKLFHARWWDYSERKFNIRGRVCLIGAVVFGAFSTVLILGIHPFVREMTGKISERFLPVITICLFILFLADNLVTIIGFTGFHAKLAELSQLLDQKKAEAAQTMDAYRNEVAHKLNGQQRRMLAAFPKLKSVKYNELLSELRQEIRRRKKEKK